MNSPEDEIEVPTVTVLTVQRDNALKDRDKWKAMASELAAAFHNYPNVQSHVNCLDALTSFNDLNSTQLHAH